MELSTAKSLPRTNVTTANGHVVYSSAGLGDVSYSGPSDTAKLIKRQLKATFPAINWSVRRSAEYHGAAVDIKWNDGPAMAEISALLRVFREPVVMVGDTIVFIDIRAIICERNSVSAGPELEITAVGPVS